MGNLLNHTLKHYRKATKRGITGRANFLQDILFLAHPFWILQKIVKQQQKGRQLNLLSASPNYRRFIKYPSSNA
jgi:hypothetical protein